MVKSVSSHHATRAPRVKLAGSILSILRLENGRQIRGKLHQLSVTGGLLTLEEPLDEGTKVEVLFHLASTTVRTKVRLLFPMWATQGCLQPFRFEELGEENRNKLQADLQSMLNKPAEQISSSTDRAGYASESD